MKYRKEIDGLRALAVLPVILFHAGFTTFSGGFVGVDIFFVISGYLITTIIVDEMDKGSFSLLNFYERRARRILPALFFVMLCTLPFAWFWMLPQELKSFSQSLVAVPLFASNVFFWLTSGYFDIASELKPLLHTWSLAVEEQYYVLFPLFLMLSWKLGKKRIISLLALVAIISALAAQWGATTHPTFTFYLLPTRAFEILIGALISLYINHKQSTISVSQSVSQLVSQSGLALVLYAIFTFDEYTPFPSFYTLIPTIGAGLILVFSNNKNLVGKLLGSKLFVGVGLISYSAYLWHQPLLVFARLSTEEPSQLLLALVPTSLVLAYFSWKYIELPFRDTTRFGKNKIMIYSLIGSIFFITVGLTGHFTYNDYDPDIDKDFVDTHSYPESENCLNTFFDSKEGKPGKCSTNSTNPKILLVGDSHAGHYYKGITSSNLDVAVIWNGGCYAGATYSENCKSRLQFIKNYIYKNRDTIKVVLLSSYLNLYVNPKNLAKRTNKEHILIYKESDGQKTIVNDISDFILFLKNLNLSVGIIYDIPELSKSPWDCKPHSCQQIQSLVDIIESQSTQRKIYSTLENYYKIKSFDPINILCDNDYCYSVRNDSLLYWDTNHLNEKGSFFLATPLVEWINQNYTR